MINENINSIIEKYILLINNYSIFFFHNLLNYKENVNLQYLYIQGFIIIENIFTISIMYMNNLIEVNSICEKGYIYFIEFINQINLSNISETYFDLTIKDAIVFCYKKTILNIDNKIKQSHSEDESMKLNLIKKISSIIKNYTIIINNYICKYLIKNNTLNTEKSILIDNINKIIKSNYLDIYKITKKILNIFINNHNKNNTNCIKNNNDNNEDNDDDDEDDNDNVNNHNHNNNDNNHDNNDNNNLNYISVDNYMCNINTLFIIINNSINKSKNDIDYLNFQKNLNLFLEKFFNKKKYKNELLLNDNILSNLLDYIINNNINYIISVI